MIDALDDWALNETCRRPSRCLCAHGLVPRDLTMEITEGVLVDLNRGIPQGLDEIYTFGMRLMTDDFGTGYFNLSYLRRRSAG